MRHTHENEVYTCEPVNRVGSCLRNALLCMECTCVNGTYKCVRICKTRAHLWMEMRICEGELAVENRATYLLTGHLRCKWDLIPMNGTTHVWTGPLTFGRNLWIISLQMEAPFTPDGLFTRGCTDYTWRTTDSHAQPVKGPLRVTGSSTCERDMYVWTGPILVKDSPRVNETSTCEWNEMSIYVWMDFGQKS